MLHYLFKDKLKQDQQNLLKTIEVYFVSNTVVPENQQDELN